MPWLTSAVVVYAILMLAGGVFGYFRAGSPASLWTGVIAGLLLLGAAAYSKTNPKQGFLVATGVSLILVGIFLKRFIDTGKAMPSLGLVGLSAIMLILLIVGHFLYKPPVSS